MSYTKSFFLQSLRLNAIISRAYVSRSKHFISRAYVTLETDVYNEHPKSQRTRPIEQATVLMPTRSKESILLRIIFEYYSSG